MRQPDDRWLWVDEHNSPILFESISIYQLLKIPQLSIAFYCIIHLIGLWQTVDVCVACQCEYNISLRDPFTFGKHLFTAACIHPLQERLPYQVASDIDCILTYI